MSSLSDSTLQMRATTTPPALLFRRRGFPLAAFAGLSTARSTANWSGFSAAFPTI
ncbi:hypothetical protein PAHAL_1G174000 [Panicum hallii]|uniref:Uncharacterized protein n=1 Tax=Panicum hallii TaxID=206008 RepID=A0A2T8KVI5_9POAL|nr:hypothetical protein PAHAL_1G174000 [Panicum hallii]